VAGIFNSSAIAQSALKANKAMVEYHLHRHSAGRFSRTLPLYVRMNSTFAVPSSHLIAPLQNKISLSPRHGIAIFVGKVMWHV
jgi:hypothetical protein